MIGRPVGLVEGAAGRVDRPIHIGRRSVADLAEHVLVGRIDVGEGPRLPVDELAVDQHPRLERRIRRVSHGAHSLAVALASRRTALPRKLCAAAPAAEGFGPRTPSPVGSRSAAPLPHASRPVEVCPSPAGTCGAYPWTEGSDWTPT